MTETGYRMHFRDDKLNTLNGHIFKDRKSAIAWLSQDWVDRSRITMEEVDIFPARSCPMCKGTGSLNPSIKKAGYRASAEAWLRHWREG